MTTLITAEWEFAQALIGSIAAALPTTQVAAGFPGDTVEAESIWIDEIRSTEMAIPVCVGDARRPYDVDFEIVLSVQVVGAGLDYTTTQARLAHLEETVLSALQDDAQVGVLDDGPNGEARMVKVAVVSSRRAAVFELPSGGPIGVGEITVSVATRIN